MTAFSPIVSARVPRYTSYPTAPHFHSGIGSSAFRAWLEALAPDRALSLYFHIPFCDTLCWFCGCHTTIINHYSPLLDYLGWLRREVDQVAAMLGTRRRVAHIHWGGGSPTLLAPDHIRALSAHIRQKFEVLPESEFAVEIDPRGLTDATIAAMAEVGVNRASIGVQDCDDTVQRAINRIQPFSVTASAVDRLRAAGIDAINIDVMYGLPYQSVAHVQQTIAAMLILGPQRYAVFGYAHVPSFKKHQALIPAGALPDEEERLRQSEAARALLTSSGYVPVGLDHFALANDPLAIAQSEGSLRRNFQGYTADTADALIGFGASAISALPEGYVQNCSDVPSWRRALATGTFAKAKGIALSREDILRRAVIERLMCDLSVDLREMAAGYGFPEDHFASEIADLSVYAESGILEIASGRIRVSPDARSFVRIVSSVFDAYLRTAPATHSVAV